MRSGAAHPRDFPRFYLAYNPRIRRYFKFETGDTQLALELTAETFEKAFKAREQCRGTTSKEALGWLWVIANNKLREHYRGHAAETDAFRRLPISRPVATEEELEQMAEQDTLEAKQGVLYDAFAKLTDKQREAIHMHVIEERSYEEMAQKLDITTVVARKRVSAGLRRLKRNASLRRFGGKEE